MKGKLRASLVAGASLALAPGTYAQAASGAQTADGLQAQPADQNQGGSQLEDIVVTAQRRSQNLQDVPVTVTAITGSALTNMGAVSTRDLSTVVPGLVFNKTLGSGTPFLRGVGQGSGAAGIEPTVAFYFDGVYIPTAGANILGLTNIAQVSVLKGPQGTLFGRNATGGVIQVTTLDPGRDPEFKADFGWGNYETLQVHAYGATPLSDNVRTAFSLSSLNQADGWGRNVFLDKEIFTRNEFAVQNKTIFELGDRTDLTSNVLYTRNRGYVGTTYAIAPGSLGSDGKTRYINEYDVATGIDTELNVEQVLGSLTLEHDLGWARFRVMGSIQDYNDHFNLDQNGIPLGSGGALIFAERDYSRTYTSEALLQSPTGQDLNWTLGLYYFNDRTRAAYTLFRDTTPVYVQDATQYAKSYAIFAQVSKTILPRTQLTLGARYTIDKKRMTGVQNTPSGALITTFDAVAAANGFPTDKTWKRPTFRVSLDHHLTRDTMLFASYNRGFKSGVFNLVTLNNRPADPEKLDAFEVGAKTALFDRRLRLNVSGFYYNYSDLQLRTVLPPSSNFILYNAAKARLKGIDVDFQAALTSRLELSGGFEILDGKYRSFPLAACTQPVPTGGNVTFTCDLSGKRMLRSPKFAGNFGLLYRVPLARKGELAFSANDNYNSGFNWEADGRLRQDSYHSVSGSVKWTLPSGDMYFKVWGSNLANEHIRAAMGEAASDVYLPGEPRTYGVTFGVNL